MDAETVTTVTAYIEGSWNNALRSTAFREDFRALLRKYVGTAADGTLFAADESCPA